MSTAEKILGAFEPMVYTGLLPEETFTQIKEEFDPSDGHPGLRAVADWWDKISVLPRILHTDNGKDFQSKDLLKWGETYQIKFYFRPVGGANYGGHVERLLETINKQAFHSIPGTTKGSIEERGDYKSSNKAILTFEQMEAIFLLVILRYHVKNHTALGISPMEAWHRAVELGDNLTPLQTDEEIKHLAYNMHPTEIRKYQENQGISINGIYYNHEAIAKNDKSWAEMFKKGEEISVRYDSNDIRFIWWWNPGLNRPVRLWATKIFLRNKIFGKNQLIRLHPLSILAYEDIKNSKNCRLQNKLAKFYEGLESSFDSVIFSFKDAIPNSTKERKKVESKMMKQLENQRIGEKEIQETSIALTGSSEIPNKLSKLEQLNEFELEPDNNIFEVYKPVALQTDNIEEEDIFEEYQPQGLPTSRYPNKRLEESSG